MWGKIQLFLVQLDRTITIIIQCANVTVIKVHTTAMNENQSELENMDTSNPTIIYSGIMGYNMIIYCHVL